MTFGNDFAFRDKMGFGIPVREFFLNNEFNEYGELQEPIIFKNFDGKPLTENNLDFENRLFEILNRLISILINYTSK